ncbi:MAG TPA: hypothetical protein VMM36_13780 [Opitutaceae bacterium]|nr:hypothetical protein [Opitutaceae bacterium]
MKDPGLASVARQKLSTRHFALGALAFFSCASAASEANLTLDPAVRHQTIEGFGTCLISWVPRMAEYYQQESFQKFYLEELGASVLRIDLWNGSAPIEKENWADISFRDFDLSQTDGRGGVFVDNAARLHERSGGKLKIIASVWSPPKWMKVNRAIGNGSTTRQNRGLDFRDPRKLGLWSAPLPDDADGSEFSMIGMNKLRHDRYLHFAKLLVEWTRFFHEKGITLHGLSPQNEPRFSQWYESCVYTPAEYAELLRVIDWMFRHENVEKPRIFGPEHMTHAAEDNRKYLDAIFSQPEGEQLIDALASHGYVDGVRMDSRPESPAAFAQFSEKYQKPVWMTEGGTGSHEWPAALNQIGVMMMTSLTTGNASLIAPWQIAEDEPSTHALSTTEGPTKKSYLAMQYFRFIRPGMVRVELKGATKDVLAAGFLEPVSKQVVLVVLNRAAVATDLRVSFAGSESYRIDQLYVTDASRDCAEVSAAAGSALTLSAPPESLLTLRLRPAN